jgi:hypothetical protein
LALAAGEVLPVSIFDGPIEGFGADISKLQKRIMEERDEFRPLAAGRQPTHH